jgi:hypothetical protein
VWSHNTTISRSTGFTPFKLLFGDEAITPEEAKAGSIRTAASAEDEVDYHVEKDTIEGTKLQAVENINKYQAETIKWRDRKVRLKNIKPGHLVLRRVANPNIVGKLQLKWKGPFLVVSSLLGRRRRHYPSLQALVNSLHQRRQDDWRDPPLHPLHCKSKAYDEVSPSHVLTRPRGSRGIRPIVTGPARTGVLRA